jgi:cyclopropane fatty-acyl-phospholipid synthase-like methyltransferase
MDKATKDDKEFYFTMRDEIHKKLSKDGVLISKPSLHDILKYNADLEEQSMKDITHEDLQTLKEWSKNFAQSIGLVIKDKKGEPDNDDLDFNRTDKHK